MGRDSSVGIAARYGLDGPGIESRWGRDFPHRSRPALGPTCTMGTGSFPGVKRPGRGADHPLPSSAEVTERVEVYLYSPSGSSWPDLGWPLPLYLPELNVSIHFLAHHYYVYSAIYVLAKYRPICFRLSYQVLHDYFARPFNLNNTSSYPFHIVNINFK